MSQQRQAINYVDNETFYNRLCEWKASGDEKIPDDIALTLLSICNNLAKSGRFCSYTWKDAMCGDALISVIKFCKNFNPEKSKNPFAFFTTIAWNAFLHRISIEKQRLEAMDRYRDEMSMMYDIQEEYEDDENKYGHIDETARNINRTYSKEPKKKKKKNEKKKIEIDDFC